MAKFSLFGDDEGPSIRKLSKRSRSDASESSSREELSPPKRQVFLVDEIHPDEEPCHHYEEEEDDDDEEEEEEEEEEEARSPSATANPHDENPIPVVANTDKSISAVITDPDVLDCSICFEPLTIPVFQCENGHIACSSCCTRIGNKCPSCSWPIGYNRCRAIEKVLESVKIACDHKRYGCEELVAYSNRKDHDSNCPYFPCSCPQSGCDFVSSYKQIYAHFGSEHLNYAQRFSYNLNFAVTFNVTDRFVVLQERFKSVLFVLYWHVETLGHAIWLSCVSPPTSRPFNYYISARNEEGFLKLQSTTKPTQCEEHCRPQTGFLLVPFGFFGSDSSKNLSFDLCIYEP